MDEKYFHIHDISLTKKLSIGVTVLLFAAIFLTVNRSLERQTTDTNAQIPETSIPTQIPLPTPTIEVSLEPTAIPPEIMNDASSEAVLLEEAQLL